MKSRQFKLFIIGVLAVTSTLAIAIKVRAETKDARYFVTNPEEFNHYVQLHKQRTKILALRLFEKYQTEYYSLTREHVDEFISLHDLSKSIPEIAQRLYKQYSRPVNLADPRTQAQFNAWVSFLNKRDLIIAKHYFTKNSLTDVQIQQLLEIEKISDLVDRSFDPVAQEDFGRKMVPASEFLKDSKMAEKARFLEMEYSWLTKGQNFLDFIQQKAHTCKSIF